MTRVADLLAAGPTLSVEFFPPKTDDAARQLTKTLGELSDLDLSFVSVTYGAGGTTRDRTRDLVVDICDTHPFPAMAHLTCMGHTTEQLTSLLDDYAASGVENILALAGDPPADGSEASGDFTYASELIELIRSRGDFSIGVAAHPELHPRSPDRASDRRHLAEKLQQADFGVTQFFFYADDYFRMIDELAALGCDTPVLPGVIPVVTPVSIARFADMAGARRPTDLWDRLESLADDPDERLKVAVDHAAGLTDELLRRGVPGVHFYALNRSEATLAVCGELGLGR
jgi:methylenetetrahydrofolate reductase (NADH)